MIQTLTLVHYINKKLYANIQSALTNTLKQKHTHNYCLQNNRENNKAVTEIMLHEGEGRFWLTFNGRTEYKCIGGAFASLSYDEYLQIIDLAEKEITERNYKNEKRV